MTPTITHEQVIRAQARKITALGKRLLELADRLEPGEYDPLHDIEVDLEYLIDDLSEAIDTAEHHSEQLT